MLRAPLEEEDESTAACSGSSVGSEDEFDDERNVPVTVMIGGNQGRACAIDVSESQRSRYLGLPSASVALPDIDISGVGEDSNGKFQVRIMLLLDSDWPTRLSNGKPGGCEQREQFFVNDTDYQIRTAWRSYFGDKTAEAAAGGVDLMFSTMLGAYAMIRQQQLADTGLSRFTHKGQVDASYDALTKALSLLESHRFDISNCKTLLGTIVFDSNQDNRLAAADKLLPKLVKLEEEIKKRMDAGSAASSSSSSAAAAAVVTEGRRS